MNGKSGVVNKVSEDNKRYYLVDLRNGTSFCLSKEYGVTPKIGDSVILHIIKLSMIRGVEINGSIVFYKTDEQLKQERKEWLENYEKEKQERFIKEKDQLDIDYESLPDIFKKRIDRFRDNNPNFRVDYESYEMFCCKEAIKIANELKTPEKIKEFSKLDYNSQMEMVPGISDQHSGNTFGASIMLAYLYLNNPDNVIKMHGTLSPLVGSKEFGDIKRKD